MIFIKALTNVLRKFWLIVVAVTAVAAIGEWSQFGQVSLRLVMLVAFVGTTAILVTTLPKELHTLKKEAVNRKNRSF